jgi:hypothetical protein
VLALPGEPTATAVLALLPNATKVTLGIPSVLPSLQTGGISVIVAPAVTASMLQWSTKLTNVNSMTAYYDYGAIVVTKKRLDAMKKDPRAALVDTGGDASTKLAMRLKSIDAAAFAGLKNTATAYEATAADKTAWSNLFVRARASMRGSPYSAALFDRVAALTK